MGPSSATQHISDSTLVAEPETTPRPASAASFLARGRRFLWPSLCFLQLGVLIGGYLLVKRPPSDQPSSPSDHAASGEIPEPAKHVAKPARNLSPETVPPTPTNADPDDLEQGDRLVRSDRADLALPLFCALRPKVAAPLRDQIEYRVALCLERLERWDEAVAAYRGLMSPRQNVRVVAAAHVGQARVAFQRGRPEEAKHLMCRMLLHAARYTKQGSSALEEAKFLLALALTREAGNRAGRISHTASHPDGLESRPTLRAGSEQSFEHVVEPATITWSLQRALRWADPPAETESQDNEVSGPVSLGSQQPDQISGSGQKAVPGAKAIARPEETLVPASFAPTPVHALLDRLASACGLKAEWTAAALRQVQGHEADADAEHTPFLDLIRNLVCPLQVVWKVQDGVVYWSAFEETPPEDLTVFRLALARRALRDAVVSQPRHELAPVAYLYLGNLEVEAGQPRAAVTWYEQLVHESQRSPVLVEANYNLGLVQRRLEDTTAARKAFYRVVDLAPGHELASHAYLILGRMWLEEGQPARAISPLRRALSAGAGSAAEPVSAVSLAASYLWAGNPQAANAVLRTYRAQVSQPPHHRLAAFLDAFSRLQAAADRRQTRHASDLLSAMINLGEESYLKSLGVLLMGQAYRELGMVDQLVAVYQPALSNARGPVAEEMSYSLAEAYLTLGKRDDAKRLWLTLAILDGSRWAAPSKFRLAQLALMENRSKEALLWCRQLLPVQPPESMPALLELMGRAFEQTGDWEQAARCFRGERPS